MPYKNKSDRNAKHEWQLEKKRLGAHEARMERQRARRAYDKKGIDRTGKDIDHIKPLSKGGKTSSGNTRLKNPSSNRSYKRNSDHTPK